MGTQLGGDSIKGKKEIRLGSLSRFNRNKEKTMPG
jgi:hypothetical protein